MSSHKIFQQIFDDMFGGGLVSPWAEAEALAASVEALLASRDSKGTGPERLVSGPNGEYWSPAGVMIDSAPINAVRLAVAAYRDATVQS